MPGGSFSWQSGQLEITGAQGLLIAAGGLVGDTVVLSAGDGLSVTHNTSIAAGASLTVGGGTFATSVLDLPRRLVHRGRSDRRRRAEHAAGSIALTGPGGVTLGSDGIPATTPIVLQATDSLTVTGLTTLATGASLAVDGGAFTSGGLTLTGGSFSAATLAGVGPLDFQLGSLTLTQEEVIVGPSGQLGATVALSASRSLHVTGMTTIAATGSLSVADGAFTTGVLKLDGGTFDAADLTGVGAVQFLAGSMTLTGAARATIGTGGVLPTTLTLDAGKAPPRHRDDYSRHGRLAHRRRRRLHHRRARPQRRLVHRGRPDRRLRTQHERRLDEPHGPRRRNAGLWRHNALSPDRSTRGRFAGRHRRDDPDDRRFARGRWRNIHLRRTHARRRFLFSGHSGGRRSVGFSVGVADAHTGRRHRRPRRPVGRLHRAVRLPLAPRDRHDDHRRDRLTWRSGRRLHNRRAQARWRRVDSADLAGVGAVEFLAGSMTLTGAAGATIGAGGVLPASLTLDAGKTLHVTATTYLTTGGSLAVAGGAFTTGVLAFNGGSFSAPI